MERYLGILNWSLNTDKAEAYRRRHPGFIGGVLSLFRDHRFAMVGAGLARIHHPDRLVHDAADVVPAAAQPGLFAGSHRHGAGHDAATRRRTVADRAAAIIEQDPAVDRVFQRIFVGSGFINIVLKKDREVTSTEFERGLTPADCGDPRRAGQFPEPERRRPGQRRPRYHALPRQRRSGAAAGDREPGRRRDAGLPELRAPRVQGDLVRPEIIIKPRFDLAADLGVTTTALSQTIRIATLGDIAQNSAKFSLADRQVPITVSLAESSRRDLATLENLPVPTVERRLRATEIGRRDRVRLGPDHRPAHEPDPPHRRRCRSCAGLGLRRRMEEDQRAADGEEVCPTGCQKLELGDSKWQAELVYYFIDRPGVGRAAGVCGAGPALSPLPVTAGQHGLADAGSAGRGHRPAS